MNYTPTQAQLDGYCIKSGERPARAPRPASPTFARAFMSRVFGVVLLAILATALIKCTV